jgi:hypothetical protein
MKIRMSVFALAMTVSAPVWASSIHAGWIEAVLEARAADDTGRATEIDHAYPHAMDWIRQDHGNSWRHFLSANQSSDRDIDLAAQVLADIDELGGRTRDFQAALTRAHSASNGRAQSKAALDVYLDAAERRRELRLSELRERWGRIAFTEHHNFQMGFIGYTEGLSDARHQRFFEPGTSLSVFELDSLYGRKTDLLQDPYGMMRDVDVSPDETKIAFAWKKSDRLDDYHIFEYDLATGAVRQLTFGLGRADYEPVYLPDGDIVFASTRPEQSVPCFWTEISNLYRMDGDGNFIRRLAIDQVHTIYPTLLENGRMIYTRWDYSDRTQNYPHPLFTMNQDGTGQRVYYGGNSWFPTSLLHARAIPGTGKVMAVASGHHTRQRGKLVTLDVSQGRDEGKGMAFIAPRRDVPYERVDMAQQDGDQFRYPYPLDERQFLVTYSPDPVQIRPDDGAYGLYWMDHEGNRELLHKGDLSVSRPVPIARVTSPPALADEIDYAATTAEYYVHDVYEGVGLADIPRGTAKKIRVVQLNYRAAGIGQSRNDGEGGISLNSSPVAIGSGSWDVKEILGDADIEADGSARFTVPAMKSIYLQVLDGKGYVVQTTRSWDTLRPGEQKACRGCHDKTDANFHPYEREETLAWTKPPQSLQPFYGPSRGFSFIEEVQPILDAKCVSCHDGSRDAIQSFDGQLKSWGTLEKRRWSQAYLSLTHAKTEYLTNPADGKRHPYFTGDPSHPVTNWIDKMSRPTELPPYSYGAATSKLMAMLEEGHGGVAVTDEERHKFAAWLDLLVPFIGDYREAHDWTPTEMAYYDYFESKRHRNHAEEQAYIDQWLGRPETVQHTPVTGRYRALTPRVEPMGDGEWRVGFSRPVVVDRVETSVAATLIWPNGSEFEVLDMATLSMPKEVISFTLRADAAPSGLKFWGRDKAELPATLGYSHAETWLGHPTGR